MFVVYVGCGFLFFVVVIICVTIVDAVGNIVIFIIFDEIILKQIMN